MAREAGVGIATLQRNFASRDDLVAAVLLERVIQYADAATDDPRLPFRDFVERVCRMQPEDLGFAAVLTTDFPDVQKLQAHRRRALREFTGSVYRAKAAGALREDLSPHDLPLILLANAGVVVGTGANAAKASADTDENGRGDGAQRQRAATGAFTATVGLTAEVGVG